MNDIQTISESFVKFLEDNGIGVFNDNLFLSKVPETAPDSTYWIITSGGSPISKNGTGEKIKQYFISVYYRDLKAKNVERTLFSLEELLNCSDCVQLQNYEVLEVEASQFPSDTDLDNEERRIGFLQAKIKVYKTC